MFKNNFALIAPIAILLQNFLWPYRGLYFDSKTLRIFATRYPQNDVQILDFDLNLKSSVNNIFNNSHSVLVFNLNLYVTQISQLPLDVLLMRDKV
jgi:hypothetical protein